MFYLDIFEQILKLNIGVSQSDNYHMFELLNSICPMKTYQYSSGSEHNGWVVPNDWIVHKALIKKDNQVLFDGRVHPLAVIGYSPSFYGTLSKKELDKHIFYRSDLPDAYPFHCTNNYRPWASTWGFCVPFNIWKTWPDGIYQVELETEYRPGVMLVGEIHHQGELNEAIVFNAHTCHPCQFNDDLAGVAVILELFQWLQSQSTYYSYRAVLGPEHLGTVFYLANLSEQERQRLKMGAFVEMVGINEPLVLQQSFTGNTIIDKVAEYVMTQITPNLKAGPFRTIVGNDETVWEAPGIEIPFISISRCYHSYYYPQYHTHEDNLAINSVEKLAETLTTLKQIIQIFESDRSIERHFTGLVALSNPKYNLYIERPEPTVTKNLSELDLKMGRAQDYLPRYFNGQHTIFEIAQKHDLPFTTLCAYLEKFAKKGLITLHPVESLDYYTS